MPWPQGCYHASSSPGIALSGTRGGMPVLDTRMWMGQEQREKGVPREALQDPSIITTRVGQLHQVILYAFYQKPMAEKVGNLQSSAAPEGQKVATCSQEIIRRLKNCSRDLHPSVVEGVIRQYMTELGEGGYNLPWRLIVLESAFSVYEKMLKKEKEGT